MKFNFVKVKNFRSFPDQETRLDLDFNGTKLIVGKNGSGKTSFFDAVIWALYGKTSVAADEVVNRETKKNCKVELDFNVGSTKYSIVRYRKHEEKGDKLLFFKNNKNVSSRVKAETQQMIDEAIQISYTAMTSSIILSSEMYSSFLRSKPSQRLSILESILSLKEVNEYAKKLKKIRKPIQEELQRLSDNKIKSESTLETLENSLIEYNNGVKSKLLNLKEKKEIVKQEIEDIKKEIEEANKIDIDKELELTKSNQSSIDHNKKLNEKIEELNEKIIDLNDKIKKLTDIKENLKELTGVDVTEERQKILNYEKKKEEIDKVKNKIDVLFYKIESKEEIKSQVKSLTSARDKKEEELNEIKEHNDTCPVCKRDGMNKELSDKILKEKQLEFDEVSQQLIEYKDKLSNIELRNKEVQKEIDLFKDKLTSMGELPENSKYTLEYLNTISDEKHKLEMDKNNLENEIKSQDVINEESKKRIKELKKELIEDVKVSKYSIEYLEGLNSELNKLKEVKVLKEKEVGDLDVEAKSSVDRKYIEDQKKKIEKEKKNKTKILNQLKEKRLLDKHYDVLNEIFSNKEGGFKKFLINKMISVFNKKVNFYIPFFFEDNIEIQFDRDLNDIITLDGNEINFQSFSSGQKTRLELAITFTLFIMVKIFFPSSVNLLVFDEILDTNLDKEGFDSVVNIIDNMSHSNAVFIVSHQEYYKEKFNHHITMKLKDKFSYISEVA